MSQPPYKNISYFVIDSKADFLTAIADQYTHNEMQAVAQQSTLEDVRTRLDGIACIIKAVKSVQSGQLRRVLNTNGLNHSEMDWAEANELMKTIEWSQPLEV